MWVLAPCTVSFARQKARFCERFFFSPSVIHKERCSLKQARLTEPLPLFVQYLLFVCETSICQATGQLRRSPQAVWNELRLKDGSDCGSPVPSVQRWRFNWEPSLHQRLCWSATSSRDSRLHLFDLTCFYTVTKIRLFSPVMCSYFTVHHHHKTNRRFEIPKKIPSAHECGAFTVFSSHFTCTALWLWAMIGRVLLLESLHDCNASVHKIGACVLPSVTGVLG